MRYLFILVLFLSVKADAQLKSYIIGVKGDTLNRIDSKGMKQGPWAVRIDNARGERGYEEEGIYVNDQKDGVWRRYSLEGDLIAVENFKYGMKDGKNVYFTYTGEPLREESWRAIDPKHPYDTVAVKDIDDPSKILRYQIVKVEPTSYKHGTWTYFNTLTGTIEATEQWVMNKTKEEIEEAQMGDGLAPLDLGDNGNKSTAKKDEEKKSTTKPKEVLEFEKKNAGKKKIKVRDGRTGG